MKKGFFSSSSTQVKSSPKIKNTASCGKCKLNKNCTSPKMEPQGTGEVKVLHVAETPSIAEDKRGQHMVGETGRYYKQILKQLGHDVDDAFKTNAVICHSTEVKKSHIEACRPNLLKVIKDFKPRVIISLGDSALRALIQPRFNEEIGGVMKWRGNLIPDREYNAWICPTFHPAYMKQDKAPIVLEKIFKQDLKHALMMQDFDFPALKPEEECVEIIKHPNEATTYLRELFKTKKLIAFDYETTGLKPQSHLQQIVSCSICGDINHVVAFPMFNDLDFYDVLKHVLSTPKIKKICSNTKFERDWTYTKLGSKLGGIYFDTMIAAHYLDNRSGITSIKHQAYTMLGCPQYDGHIKKFLMSDESQGGNTLNEIHKIDTRDLLVYNGIDSLLEFRVALVQMDILGMDYSEYYDGPKGFDFCPHIKGVRECV